MAKTTKHAIENRDLYKVTGRLSQTINICTDANDKGNYQYRITLYKNFLTDEELNSKLKGAMISEIVRWLLVDHEGKMDNYILENGDTALEVEDGEVEIFTRLPAYLPVDEKLDASWIAKAKEVAERCIDELVNEFLEKPYLHRVEHSIHARLYELLRSHAPLDSEYAIDGGLSQPVHKEWPEAIPRPEKNNRRGLFDIAILFPSQLSSCTPKDFKRGLLKPAIAIEMGLNYGSDHLAGDVKKMINSNISHGYLIHLVRDKPLDVDGEVKRIINNLRSTPQIQVALAHVHGNERHIKLLSDTESHSM